METTVALMAYLCIALLVSTVNVWLVHLLFINGGGRHNHILTPLARKFGQTRVLVWHVIVTYVAHLVSILGIHAIHISFSLLTVLLAMSLWNAKHNYDSYRRLRNMLESQE